MNIKEQNIQWLSDHQSDLIKIVGKHIKPNHKLSVEEVVSDVNNYFITKLIDKKFENRIEFNKFIYRVALNFVKWTAKGSVRKDQLYNKHAVDYTFFDEEGTEKTAFDHICDTVGEQDPEFIKLNRSEKYENILKWLIDYSDVLTPRQKNILPFVMQGKTLDALAQALGVTHQAISHNILDMYERIKSYLKVNINEDCDKTVLIEGNKSINYLFGDGRKRFRALKKSVT